jgi:hypothetical protein
MHCSKYPPGLQTGEASSRWVEEVAGVEAAPKSSSLVPLGKRAYLLNWLRSILAICGALAVQPLCACLVCMLWAEVVGLDITADPLEVEGYLCSNHLIADFGVLYLEISVLDTEPSRRRQCCC